MRPLLLLVCLLIYFIVPAQQLTPEQKKKLEDDLKKAEEQLRKALQESGNAVPFIDNGPGSVFHPPVKNTSLLNSIPKKIFTQAEFTAYVQTLLKKFETVPKNKQIVKFVQEQNVKTAGQYRNLALLLWYGGKREEAIYASLMAVSLNEHDLLSINNLCAFLNIAGYPHKSIPMLLYASRKEPKSTLLLNNTGQAYYQLGDLSTASTYLTRCIQIDNFHIEANNTQGHIESANGNEAAAQQHYRNSLKGGYNTSAAQRLGQKGQPVGDYLNTPSPRTYPMTADNIGFQCPTLPVSPGSNITFNAKMKAESEAWDRAGEEYKMESEEKMRSSAMNMVNMMQAGSAPAVRIGNMHEKATLIMSKAFVEYNQQFARLTKDYSEWLENFNSMVARRQAECMNASDCCPFYNAIQAEVQPLFVQRYNQYCQEIWANAIGYFNTVAYWQPFFTSHGGIFSRDLVQARVVIYFTAAHLTSAAHVPDISCQNVQEEYSASKNAEFKDPECRFSLKIPLGVGDLEVNCSSITVSGGVLFVAEAGYNFTNHQTTLAAGFGAEFESGFVGAEASAKYFFTFDGSGTMQDAGIIYSAELSAAQMEAGPFEFNAASAESSLVIGVNSGVTASTEVTAFNYEIFSKETNIYSFANN